MSTPDDDKNDLFYYESHGFERAKAKSSAPPKRYKAQRGIGVLKLVRRTSLTALRRIKIGAKLTEYVSSNEEDKSSEIALVEKDAISPTSRLDLVEVPVVEEDPALNPETEGAGKEICVAGVLDGVGVEHQTSGVQDLEVGDVVEAPESPDSPKVVNEGDVGPCKGAKRVRSRLPARVIEADDVFLAYLQNYYTPLTN